MVSYQAWVSIVFETVEDGSSIDNIQDGAGVMEFAGETWSSNTTVLSRYSQQEAKQAAREMLRG